MFFFSEELFRQRLVAKEKENILLREENQRLKIVSEGSERRIRDLESRLVNAEAANTSLQRRVGAFSDQKAVLENEVRSPKICICLRRAIVSYPYLLTFSVG